MNWLAHILLAGENADDQLGGVLADLVPMNVARTLPAGLRRGIALHHSIDAYSDAHPAVCASNRRLSEAGVGLRPAAAAIAVDMLYDHLLARNWSDCCPAVDLALFAEVFYRRAADCPATVPPDARIVFEYMRAENWLVSYRELDSIRHTLERIRRRLSARAAAVSPLARAVDVFAGEPDAFEKDFVRFWPDITARADAFLADASLPESAEDFLLRMS